MMRLTPSRLSRDQLANCLGCGYPLHGKSSGRCSECGLPIDTTVDVHHALEQAPRSTILSFAWRMTMTTLLLVVLIPVGMTLFGRFSDGSSAFALVMSGPLIVSSWLLTPGWQSPVAISNGFGPRDRVRRLTRWGSFIWIVLATGSLLIAFGITAKPLVLRVVFDFLWGVVCLACLFQVFLMVLCLERLAYWMRDEFACSMIRFIHLSLIVIGIGVLVGIIGPILFPISPGLFPIYSTIVFFVMMLIMVVLLLVMSKTAWFTLMHQAENTAADRRVRDRFDAERSANDGSDIRL